MPCRGTRSPGLSVGVGVGVAKRAEEGLSQIGWVKSAESHRRLQGHVPGCGGVARRFFWGGIEERMMATRLPPAQNTARVTGVPRDRQACRRGAEAGYQVIAPPPSRHRPQPIRNAERIIHPDAGHGAQVQNPDRVLKHAVPFPDAG